MKIKDLFKVIQYLKNTDGCIVIKKIPYGAVCSRFGEFSTEEQIKYLGDIYSNN